MSRPIGRILALDLGTRRIGIAVSDELGILARGLDTLIRSNKRADLEVLNRIAMEHQVRLILLGNPLRLSGEAGSQSDWARKFGDDLQARTELPVELVDERLTSAAAAEVLRGKRIHIKDRKAAIDRMAAIILLQGYLDAHPVSIIEHHL